MRRKERKKLPSISKSKTHLPLLGVRGAVAGADLLDIDTVVSWLIRKEKREIVSFEG